MSKIILTFHLSENEKAIVNEILERGFTIPVACLIVGVEKTHTNLSRADGHPGHFHIYSSFISVTGSGHIVI